MNQETKQPKGGIAGRLNMAGWRKHYVAAMTADEEAWPQREPGSNLGRVFIIILLLHVFLIGAVVLYNVIAPKTAPATANAKSAVAKPNATPLNTATSSATPKAVAVTPAPSKPAQPPVPVPAAQRPDVKPIETGSYEVRSGDNVPGIAAALGVRPEELIKLNNLDNTELYPGRKLTYPKKPAAPVLKAVPVAANTVNTPPAKPESFKAVTPAPAKEITPPVKLKDNAAVSSADTPPKPAPKTTVASADQPPAKTNRKDETSGGTAKKTESEPAKTTAKTDKSSKTEPKTASKTDKNSKTDSKTASKSDKSSKDSAGRRSHVVGPKETLYSIARKYGVKVDALQKANGIKDPTTLRDGMKLVIPSKN